MLIVGIDPGVATGFARWNTTTQRFEDIATMPIHRALLAALMPSPDLVIFEDARLRQFFTRDAKVAKYGAGVREGVGSIKRDCGIWEAFLTDKGVPFIARKPQRGATKWTAAHFATITGWTGRTSEHARDAAVLVYRLTEPMVARMRQPSGAVA